MTAPRGRHEPSRRCAAFERWLDDGRPERVADAVRAHASSCRACAAALAAATAIDAWFAADASQASVTAEPVRAPDTFTDVVMARVARSESVARPAAIAYDALPWWVQIVLQPATILASIVAALLAWRGGALLQTTAALVSGITPWAVATEAATRHRLSGLVAGGGLAGDAFFGCLLLVVVIVAVPPALLLSRWTAGLVARRVA